MDDDLTPSDGRGSSPSAVLTILDGMQGAGVNVDVVCAAMGLTRAALETREALVPPALLTVMWREGARLYGRGTVGLATAMAAPKGRQIFDYVASSSATLHQALQQIARYHRLVTRNADLQLRREGAFTLMQFLPSLPSATLPPFVLEYATATIVRRVFDLVGGRPCEVRLPHPPLGPREDYARLLGAPVRFEEDPAIVFDDELLAMPCREHDPNLFRFVSAHAESLLQREPRDTTTRAEVRRLVFTLVERGEPALSEVAHALATSARSLQRRLREEGTSFRDVVDDARKELALTYLADRKMPVSEVAYLLGYSDAGAFVRAFKRWVGKTPGETRSGRALPASSRPTRLGLSRS